MRSARSMYLSFYANTKTSHILRKISASLGMHLCVWIEMMSCETLRCLFGCRWSAGCKRRSGPGQPLQSSASRAPRAACGWAPGSPRGAILKHYNLYLFLGGLMQVRAEQFFQQPMSLSFLIARHESLVPLAAGVVCPAPAPVFRHSAPPLHRRQGQGGGDTQNCAFCLLGHHCMPLHGSSCTIDSTAGSICPY